MAKLQTRAGTPAPQCGTGVLARQIAENGLEIGQTPVKSSRAPIIGLLIDVSRWQSRSSNALAEHFLFYRKSDPFFGRIWIGPQTAKLKENILVALCHPLALEEVLLPRGHNHFHP